MIKVLQNWIEIGEANRFLSRKGLSKHSTAEKNWDLYQLFKIVSDLDRNIKIIDLGCGEMYALKLLYDLGFINLYGIDFDISFRHRLSQISIMWKRRSINIPFHLKKGDITKTSMPAEGLDLAICISVIEHNVNLEKFISECYRILKPGGLLFITTDYWEEKILVEDERQPFGLPWKIFSKKEIENFIELSKINGFSLLNDSSIPECSEKSVVWNSKEYTFINIVFKKR